MIQCHSATGTHGQSAPTRNIRTEDDLLSTSNTLHPESNRYNIPSITSSGFSEHSPARWLRSASEYRQLSDHATRTLKSDDNFLKNIISKAAENYIDFANYIPKNVLGIDYKDPADHIDSAVGNSLLAYGVYNKMSRQESFRQLKQRLMKSVEERKTLLEARMKEINSLSFALEKLNSNTRMITSYQNMLDEKINSEIQEHLNFA